MASVNGRDRLLKMITDHFFFSKNKMQCIQSMQINQLICVWYLIKYNVEKIVNHCIQRQEIKLSRMHCFTAQYWYWPLCCLQIRLCPLTPVASKNLLCVINFALVSYTVLNLAVALETTSYCSGQKTKGTNNHELWGGAWSCSVQRISLFCIKGIKSCFTYWPNWHVQPVLSTQFVSVKVKVFRIFII